MARRNNSLSGDDIPKKKLNKDSLEEIKWLWKYLKPYKIWIILGFIVLLGATIPSLLFPAMTGKLANIAINKDAATGFFKNIKQVALFLIGITVFQATFSYLRVMIFANITERVIADIVTQVYDKIIGLPISFFESVRIGELNSRISADSSQLHDTLSVSLAEFLRGITTLVGGMVVIFFIIPKQLIFLMLATLPVFMLLAMYFGKYIRKLSKENQEALASANVVVNETLHSIHSVKTYTNEYFESLRYRNAISNTVKISIKTAKYRGAFISFIISGFFGAVILILWYGFHLIENNQMMIGDLISFMFYSIFIGASIGSMGELYSQLQKTMGATERLRNLLKEVPEIDLEMARTKENFPALKGKIEFKNVAFSYPSRQDIEVLNDVSFSINEGEKIAIAGESGSGKSTIAQLILQFYTQYQGSIKVDDQEISAFNLTYLRNSMAAVPQDIVLFGGTIKENIAYAKLNATDEEIRAAARKAYALEFIEKFPEGMETIVGERGIKLSGGQRQRIAIARAILKDPSILILDEATSSLDAQSEVKVQSALDELMKGRTTIIIAHRLSTIKNVDRIYVLDKGKIVEQGHYDTLAVSDGIFSHLIKLQNQGLMI